jgi:hypothetical protein
MYELPLKYFVIILCSLSFFVANRTLYANEEFPVNIIEEYPHHPYLRILDASEIDNVSCSGYSPSLSNWIQGDFNRDGRRDYAVFLITGIGEKTITWKEKTLPLTELDVVAFISEKNNGYATTILETISSSSLSAIGVGLEITYSDKGYPGIGLVYCEKSDRVYVWEDGIFRVEYLSD